jgi:hypothetical protein
MSQTEQSEKLVLVYHARNEWEGNLLVSYLRDNKIDATLRSPPSVAPLDAAEALSGSDRVNGVFVLEHEAPQAREFLRILQSTVADEQLLEHEAAQRLKLNKETIAQLRGVLKEEKKTFEFLGWIGFVFFGAAAALWAIWPAWLKIAPLPGVLHWMIVILLALAALFAGSWASRHFK